MKRAIRIITIFILLFLALGGLYGGWTMIDDPTGGTFGNEFADLIKFTPFRDFLVPGIILWLFNGLLPLFIAFKVAARSRNHAWFIIMQGNILFIWLTTELIMSKELYSSLFHPLYYTVSVLLIASGVLLLKLK